MSKRLKKVKNNADFVTEDIETEVIKKKCKKTVLQKERVIVELLDDSFKEKATKTVTLNKPWSKSRTERNHKLRKRLKLKNVQSKINKVSKVKPNKQENRENVADVQANNDGTEGLNIQCADTGEEQNKEATEKGN